MCVKCDWLWAHWRSSLQSLIKDKNSPFCKSFTFSEGSSCRFDKKTDWQPYSCNWRWSQWQPDAYKLRLLHSNCVTPRCRCTGIRCKWRQCWLRSEEFQPNQANHLCSWCLCSETDHFPHLLLLLQEYWFFSIMTFESLQARKQIFTACDLRIVLFPRA